MAFTFQQASCVVVGTFNMYILNPQWLADHGIIERGTEVKIDTNLARPGFRFHLKQCGGVWTVTPDRVVVEADDPGRNCGDVIARILEALPETPLVAIGNNAVFQGTPDELDELNPAIRNFPQIASPHPDEAVAQRTFHVGVKRGEHETTNLQLALKEDAIELSCNAHVKLEGRNDANPAAVAAAQRFLKDRAHSKLLAKHFFGAATNNDNDAHDA